MSKQTATPSRPVRTATRTTGARTATTSARTAARKSSPVIRPFQMPFEQKNLMWLLIGVLVIGLGYLVMWLSPTMSFGALTLSPIILLIGYCVIVPMGIMAGTRTRKQAATSEHPTGGVA